jgi:hypothetical protein
MFLAASSEVTQATSLTCIKADRLEDLLQLCRSNLAATATTV